MAKNLRDAQGGLEDGRSARFLLFEPRCAARKLRSLLLSRCDSKPKNSRLAYLPPSHPPCKIRVSTSGGPSEGQRKIGRALAVKAIVLRFLRWFIAVMAAGVILLPHPRVCCAAETTQRGITAGIFAGAGSAEDDNNEGAPDLYDLHRAGGGVLGVLRFSSSQPPTNPERELGFFAQGGAAAEVEWWKQTQCGAFCGAGASFVPGPYRASHKLGWRLGVGYGFSVFEFRVGLLQVLPSQDSMFPTQFVFPDAVLRFGRRSLGWFELGLGAYDASTSLRPGIYIGGGGFPVELVRVSGHAGVHLTQGICCQTVGIGADPVVEMSLDHAFTRSLVGGVGATFNGAFEGSAHVSLLL